MSYIKFNLNRYYNEQTNLYFYIYTDNKTTNQANCYQPIPSGSLLVRMDKALNGLDHDVLFWPTVDDFAVPIKLKAKVLFRDHRVVDDGEWIVDNICTYLLGRLRHSSVMDNPQSFLESPPACN